MSLVWKVSALEAPRVLRRCPRCDTPRRFASSGKFRVNAQKRRLDVWLVYRCEGCRYNWDATVVERSTPEDLGPLRLGQYERNDPEAAWRCAFAVPGADRAVPYRVERPGDLGRLYIQLCDPLRVRLDRLLAGELGLTRAEVARRMDDGRIAGDLRREVADGQVVWVEG
jgi:hypothetical protein